MFEVKPDTGWFKYKGREVPSDVIKHLQTRSDVHFFTHNNDDVEFYSQNKHLPTDLYDENGEDGFKDYGVLFTNTIDAPKNLPDELRNDVTVDDYFENDEIIELVKAVNVSGDPRNYIIQNRLRFDTPDNHRDNGHPLELTLLIVPNCLLVKSSCLV